MGIGIRQNSPYTKYSSYERPHQSGKHLYPYVNKSFKIQHGRIPMNPAILAAIGHYFGSEAMHAETRNRALFFGGGGGGDLLHLNHIYCVFLID